MQTRMLSSAAIAPLQSIMASCFVALMLLLSPAWLAHAQPPPPANTPLATFQWRRMQPAAGPQPPTRAWARLQYAPRARKLVLFGGSGASEGETWVFELVNRTWFQAAQQGPHPSPRTGLVSGLHVAVDGSEHMVIAHGINRGQNNNEVWSFSLGTLTWRQLANDGDSPAARYGHAGGIFPGSDWLLFSHGFNTRRYSDVHAYSVTAQRWVELSAGGSEYDPTWPHPRCLVGSALVTATRMAFYGGCLQSGFTGGPCPSRDTWILDFQGGSGASSPPSSIKWSRLPDGPSPRTRSAMARAPLSWGLGAGLALLVGGEEKGPQTISVSQASSRDLDFLDTEARRWLLAQATGEAPAFRAAPALATSEEDAGIFLFGGSVPGTGDTNELWLLTRGPDDTSTPGVRPSDRFATLGGPNGTAVPVRRNTETSVLYIHLHGLFMGLAWGILLPTGVFLARYLRHRDPLWFHLHRAAQVTGLSLAIVGFVLVFVGGAGNPVFAHGMIGIIVMALGVLQPVNAFFRPHKGERYRDTWEYLHKGSGYLAVALGLVNVSLGVFLVVGPTDLVIAWFVILGVMVVLVAALEVRLWWKKRTAMGHVKGAAIEPGPLAHPAGKEGRTLSAGAEVLPVGPAGPRSSELHVVSSR